MGSDLEDLEGFYGEDPRPVTTRKGHCSALVRLLPEFNDIFFAHETWTSFNSMLRVYKHYEFPFHETPDGEHYVAAINASFPSYPASVFSSDDFYVLSSGEQPLRLGLPLCLSHFASQPTRPCRSGNHYQHLQQLFVCAVSDPGLSP